MITRKQVKNSTKRYDKSQEERSQAVDDSMFNVADNIKAEYDMWSWIYQEIANIRMECSRLGTFVRVNTADSPRYIEPYHSHIYSLLIPISVVIDSKKWRKIDNMWLQIKKDINSFKTQRLNIPNKKIPFELIRDLDKLYRLALMIAQKVGLGFKISIQTDMESAIETAITGD